MEKMVDLNKGFHQIGEPKGCAENTFSLRPAKDIPHDQEGLQG
jgi:hypothetical protein